MSDNDLKPCERVTYVHCLSGGPADGDTVPSTHCYETCEVDGEHYERVGDAYRLDDYSGWQVLNCTDDYSEPVFYRVDMKYVPAKGTP